jgi:hypothetical protein
MKYSSEINKYNSVDYCVYSDMSTQEATVNNAKYVMQFNTFEEGHNITVVNDTQSPTPKPTKITVNRAGVYNIAFSAQLDRVASSGTAEVNIWLRKNGETSAFDVPRTDTKVTMTGNAGNSKTVAAWNFVVSAEAGDYFQLMWSPTDHNIHIVSAAAVTTPGLERPAIPSVILTVWRL